MNKKLITSGWKCNHFESCILYIMAVGLCASYSNIHFSTLMLLLVSCATGMLKVKVVNKIKGWASWCCSRDFWFSSHNKYL